MIADGGRGEGVVGPKKRRQQKPFFIYSFHIYNLALFLIIIIWKYLHDIGEVSRIQLDSRCPE